MSVIAVFDLLRRGSIDFQSEGAMSKASQMLARLAVILFLLGALPALIRMFGYAFLPSPDWAAKTSLTGPLAGLGIMALMLWAVSRSKAQMPSYKKYGAMAGAVFLGFIAGRNLVVVAGPMLLALIAGQQVEHTFTVAHADHGDSKWCRSRIGVEGLPLLFDEICGVPSDFRQDLAPGKRIVVIGQGTSVGVFPSEIRAD